MFVDEASFLVEVGLLERSLAGGWGTLGGLEGSWRISGESLRGPWGVLKGPWEVLGSPGGPRGQEFKSPMCVFPKSMLGVVSPRPGVAIPKPLELVLDAGAFCRSNCRAPPQLNTEE